MQREITERKNFVENNELPVLETPHFDDEQIARARPVQPLAPPSQIRIVSKPRMTILVAIIVAGLAVTAVSAIEFVKSNSPLGSASDAPASSQIAAPARSVAEGSSEKIQNDITRDSKRRTFTLHRFERPRVIGFDDGDDRKRKARLVTVIQ